MQVKRAWSKIHTCKELKFLFDECKLIGLVIGFIHIKK